jgi:hypothetical protein
VAAPLRPHPSVHPPARPQVGACYSPAGDRGYAAYSAFRGCFNLWISPPGFQLLPDWALAACYLAATVWLFLGVAIASDIFMDSIMTITSATRTVHALDPATGKRVAVGRTKGVCSACGGCTLTAYTLALNPQQLLLLRACH